MKALAWNILAFILRYVPNLLKAQNLKQAIITHAEVLELLKMQPKIYTKLFENSKVSGMI